MAMPTSVECSRPTTTATAAADEGGSASCKMNKKRRRRRCFSVSLEQQAVPAPPPSSAVRPAHADPGTLAAAAGRVAAPAPVTTTTPPASGDRVSGAFGGRRSSSFRSAGCRRPQHDHTAGAAAALAAAAGVLGRAATSFAAAGVLAAAAVASAPVGVGALVTDSQCKVATLRGTEADLGDSPRLDTSTEAAAAGVDQAIVATNATYDRMVLDQLQITILEEGRDVKFRNLWSDHVWKNTARMTFPGADVLVLLEEGSPAEFICMNEHYGLSFEKGEAGETYADGELTSDKVLNWSLLGADYLALDGVSSFTPTEASTLPSTTFLAAAREPDVSEELTPDFHYFLAEPAEDMDPSACPEPCSEQVVTYYWSSTAGTVYQLDMADVSAEPPPCWLGLFQAVADGPPAEGVDPAVWEATVTCTAGLLQAVEESMKGRWLRKIRTTDEAWGEELDGNGKGKAPRPPTGKFKLGIDGGVAVAASRAPSAVAAGADRLKASHAPQRVFTDVSIDEGEAPAGGMAATTERKQQRVVGMVTVDEELGGNEGGEDMVYPM
ncbi:hypothetical protein Esi_0264_0017 [Ectocarpus siliculosus]|uniref:Uncharacterized protein n=1 Tax=Ectocarpus siliculosus TaxID=2880 RepID=D8LJR6_ECTSI|nr:hypothetical protein Esi_0264_0017 [Ectocarpus siliculosus]|eukprot:CBN75986.1 hypothetical protein Esi_0264_0017 [Ectocarpus siliculosus]